MKREVSLKNITVNDGFWNGLQELRIPKGASINVERCEDGLLAGMSILTLTGERVYSTEELYSEEEPTSREVTMKAIPYYAWGNRGINQMKVWMLEV